MRIIADLQIHSKYARATSKDICFENLEKYARIKGIDLLGTGDFQHPKQYKEIQSSFREDENGILWTKTNFPFIWQTEVSLMFSQGGKRRAVHLLIFAPNGIVAESIIAYLKGLGRLDYDGRPIFGISCKNLVRDLKKIDDMIEIIPAHCMTPWFGVFGSGSGFDSLEECFEEQVENVYAIESGMSADPSMLNRLKENVNIVSFSDAHSFWPWRIGREATVFDIKDLSYENIIKAIRTTSGLDSTIETYPEYGKYHFDGHRNCKFSCAPEKTKQLKGICPVCSKPLTIGVEYRIEELAKENKECTKNKVPFSKLLPLHELCAFAYKSSIATKKTWSIYNLIIEKTGSELNALLNAKEDLLEEAGACRELVELIFASRAGELAIKPGYDGEYGIIEAPGEDNNRKLVGQNRLF